MDKNKPNFIPALRFRWLTKLFDPFLQVTMPEKMMKDELIKQAGFKKGYRVLDLGCGTATLTVGIKNNYPEAEVSGIDIDEKILEIAKNKIDNLGLDISLKQGSAFDLPFPDEEFDRVVSSLMLHHLTTENKRRALKEGYRILRSGGEIYILDFGKPHNNLMYLISLFMRRLEETADNFKGMLPKMMDEAGFDDIQEINNYNTLFSTVTLYKASKFSSN